MKDYFQEYLLIITIINKVSRLNPGGTPQNNKELRIINLISYLTNPDSALDSHSNHAHPEVQAKDTYDLSRLFFP